MIEAGKRKLIDHLGTKVVDDQKVAVNVFDGIVAVALCHRIAKPLELKIRDHADRAVVVNVISALDDGTRHGGGKMRFSKSRTAQKQKASRHGLVGFDGKALGILTHGMEIPTHDLLLLRRCAVVVKREILERLTVHQSRKPRRFHTCFHQTAAHTFAHFDAHVARIAAIRARIARITVVLRVAALAQQLVSHRAKLLVFTSECGDRPCGVTALERGFHDAQSKARKLSVHFA